MGEGRGASVRGLQTKPSSRSLSPGEQLTHPIVPSSLSWFHPLLSQDWGFGERWCPLLRENQRPRRSLWKERSSSGEGGMPVTATLISAAQSRPHGSQPPAAQASSPRRPHLLVGLEGRRGREGRNLKWAWPTH